MNSGFRKAAITLGLVIVGLGTAYSGQLVTSEIVFLHSKLTTPVQSHSEAVVTTWAPIDSALNTTSDFSPNAIHEILGAGDLSKAFSPR